MIYINKGEPPHFWKEYIQNHSGQQYRDLEGTEESAEFRKKIREHNIKLQHGLCCYCCRKITENNASNEHIRPQSTYPKETLDYHNILSSCNTAITCTSRKGSRYDESLFVSPMDPSCEEEFDISPTGQLSSKSPKGKYTIELLNLNSKELCNARRAMYQICRAYANPESLKLVLLTPDSEGNLPPFADTVKYFYRHIFKSIKGFKHS